MAGSFIKGIKIFHSWKLILILFLFTEVDPVFSQPSISAREEIDTLTSSYFRGRGYVDDGLRKAARYIAARLSELGIKPMGESYFQALSYPVNTFPGELELVINGEKQEPGYDYLVVSSSAGRRASGKLVQTDSITFSTNDKKVSFVMKDKLTWTVSTDVKDETVFQLLKDSVKTQPESFETVVDNRFMKKFRTENVCGIIRGTDHPDSVILFTAHYDYLGGMGRDIYFPGANDNASGIAMLLALAEHYSRNPPSCSVGFIFFTGEEAGLIGSKYFTTHPLIPLSSIRFVLNLDLVGTGVEGITVVNGSVFENEFSLLKSVNEKHGLLPEINTRGKAANSDHYWFSEKGIPSFFIYTLGGIKAYHDVHDIEETLPLNEFDDLLKLITLFADELM